ncbi:restriction endonuclease subunit S [Streptomyces adustus]|uniref:restriction endonuclease subunit S n=1 Tax=Streptomyces adustus TaxID=1609272 RepID=UPI0035E05773
MSSTIQNFNAERYANMRFAVPDGAHQHRIANFLDGETAKLNRIEGHSHRLTGLLEERKSALVTDCFSFDSADHVPSLPLRRAVKRWIDYRGATPSKTDSGTPLVTAKNIRNGRIDLEASREYIAVDAYTEWMRRGLLEKKDILLTTEAPLGQVAMVNDTSIALAQRVIVLRAKEDVCSPEWLYWYLRSPLGQAELDLRATGSTALGIKADRLRGVPIPLPALSEAARRLHRLSETVAQVDSLQQQLIKQRALITERRRTLVTAAVTGQFDVSTASGRNVTEGVTV